MNKKAMVAAVLLAVAVIVCGGVLTHLQNRADFPTELQEWYIANAENAHNTAWLAENDFTYSEVLKGYNRQFSTTGGYTSVTFFDTDTTATRFEANHDYYDTQEKFTYQFTIGTKTDDCVWINIFADNRVSANTAVKEITQQLNEML